jgi:exosome complex RNA-binding protein Csl4
MSGARWSGTESRHRQSFCTPDRLDNYGVCACVALKCHGTMFALGDGTRVKCDRCGLIIKRPAKKIIVK